MRTKLLIASIAIALVGSTRDARAQEPAPAPPTRIMVHIDSPAPVDLEARRGKRWEVACTSPCDVALSPNDEYRINGRGVRASKPFSVGAGSRVTLHVEPASSGSRGAGIAVVVVGSVALAPAAGVTGAVVAAAFFGVILICPIAEAINKGVYGKCMGDVISPFTELYTKPLVWIPALAGVALLTTGGVLLSSSSSTTVRVAPTDAARTPEWKDANSTAWPRAAFVPLVDARF